MSLVQTDSGSNRLVATLIATLSIVLVGLVLLVAGRQRNTDPADVSTNSTATVAPATSPSATVATSNIQPSITQPSITQPSTVPSSIIQPSIIEHSTVPPATVAPEVAAEVASSWWTPDVHDRWLYQIGSSSPDVGACAVPVDGGECVHPTVWVIDLFTADGTTPNVDGVAAIHKHGGRAVCYVSAGSAEDWRPDYGAFGPLLGKPLEGWPGERWIDIRALTILRPLMVARANQCKASGFDAIDWDNVDGYTNNTGFPLSGDDQLAYNRMLAEVTHQAGLSVGLKNDLEQVRQLVDSFDFAVNEQCAEFSGDCALLLPFSRAGKAVVEIEYSVAPGVFCPVADANNWAAMAMSPALTARPWKPCR